MAEFSRFADADGDALAEPEGYPDAAPLRAHLGEEIYAIFVEEITEIHQNFQEWIPRWAAQRNDSELLRDIRRGYHTCKGSGRMAGALALGDYSWAHERTLNQVLEGGLPINQGLVDLLQASLQYLGRRLPFFLAASEADTGVKAEIGKVEAFIENPEAPTRDSSLLTFDSLIEAERAELDLGAIPDSGHTGTRERDSELLPFDTLADLGQAELADALPEPAADGLGWLTFAEAELPAADLADTGKAVFEPSTEGNSPDDFLNPVGPPAALANFDEQEENRIVWEMFREELPEQLQSLDSLMQSLQENPANREARQSLERELHTLKGGARMARLMDMGDIAHNAESILEQLGRSASAADVGSRLSVLQEHVDQINGLADRFMQLDRPVEDAAVLVKTAKTPEPDKPVSGPGQASFVPMGTPGPAEVSHDSLLERLLAEQAAALPDISVLAAGRGAAKAASKAEEDLSAAGGQEQIRLPAAFLDRMVERAGALNVQQNGLAERLQLMADDVGEFGRTASRLKQLLRSLEMETEAQIHAGYRHSAAAQGKDDDFDPLEMDEYSEIQRLSRALAESLNDLVNIEADLAQQLRTSGLSLKESLGTSRNLHHDLLETRLVEVMMVVPRLRRIVRQTASELERDVALEIEGEAFKLDRHLLQKMTAPLEHLLRNAVSHGIESADDRVGLGKAGQGRLVMKVFREDTEIVLQVSDDGRGLNRQRLRGKAVELGLVRQDERLGDQETLRLILHPGFTTASTVSQIAGRGVGMDVVNAEVKALGGALQIDSVEGQGTTFSVRLPFAMAANPVLFVGVQAQTYALPMGYVQGLMRLESAQVQQYLDDPDKLLSFNDEDYPLHYLGAVLEPGAQLQMQAEHMYPVVFVRTSGHCMAWVVDAISGRREVVLQSLGTLFTNCRYYSAATITTDGQVVLLPDMADLAHRVKYAIPTTASVTEDRPVTRTRHERPQILVVDDSITVRKVTEKLLLSQNHLVETAKDGLDALEKLDKFEPDLILMDIEMPRMDGFEVLGVVRQNPHWDEVPIIMISSRTADKHRQRAEQLGANGFLGKPYQNQELLELIRSYLNKDHRQRAEAVA